MKNFLIGLSSVLAFLLVWELLWWGLGVKPLLPWRLKTALEENTENFSLLDVRTLPEYEFFHMSGTRNHPELLLYPELLKTKDPSKPLVVICLTGHRSAVVAYRLKKRGFKKTLNLSGGMLGWLLSGGQIRRGKK